jgi:hypothetical protein
MSIAFVAELQRKRCFPRIQKKQLQVTKNWHAGNLHPEQITQAFFTNSDFSPMDPNPSILQLIL